jgi:hypothetical protein
MPTVTPALMSKKEAVRRAHERNQEAHVQYTGLEYKAMEFTPKEGP